LCTVERRIRAGAAIEWCVKAFDASKERVQPKRRSGNRRILRLFTEPLGKRVTEAPHEQEAPNGIPGGLVCFEEGARKLVDSYGTRSAIDCGPASCSKSAPGLFYCGANHFREVSRVCDSECLCYSSPAILTYRRVRCVRRARGLGVVAIVETQKV